MLPGLEAVFLPLIHIGIDQSTKPWCLPLDSVVNLSLNEGTLSPLFASLAAASPQRTRSMRHPSIHLILFLFLRHQASAKY